MPDIVEELRSADFTGHDSTGYVMEKGAKEIERLRAALREIADDPTGVSIAQAEIAKRALTAPE